VGGDNVLKHEAGLPNITGTIDSEGDDVNAYSGAFFKVVQNINNYPNQNTGGGWTTYFSASASNSIYGNSETVMPCSFQLIPQIRY